MDIPNGDINEYDNGSVHEIYNFDDPVPLDEISDFIRDHTPDIEAEYYFVRVSYIDENGKEQWIQSDTLDPDEYDEFIEDIADDMEAYGVSGYGSVSVGYIGRA